jgi:hypothetical protein
MWSAINERVVLDEQKKILNSVLLSLIPCSWVNLDKLTVANLVKKFLLFCKTWRFITVYVRADYKPYPEPDDSF